MSAYSLISRGTTETMIFSFVVAQFLYMLVANGQSQQAVFEVATCTTWLEIYLDNCIILNIATTEQVFQHRTIIFLKSYDYCEMRIFFLCSDASVENMRYLNIEQALADLAHFIFYLRDTHPEYVDSQIIMVGGSYSATMVAWFRQK